MVCSALAEMFSCCSLHARTRNFFFLTCKEVRERTRCVFWVFQPYASMCVPTASLEAYDLTAESIYSECLYVI